MNGLFNIEPERGWFEVARTKAFGAIGANYSAIGTEIEHPSRIFIINNFTDAACWISIDGVEDYFAIAAGGNLVIDDATNGISLPKGTIFYAKVYDLLAAPTVNELIVSVGYRG